MKLRFLFILFSFFTFFIGFLLPKTALAADYSLSGTVKNSTGTAIEAATINVYTPGTTTDVVSPTTTNQSGVYNFASVAEGTYDIEVTPPSGSNLSPIIALSQAISGNTVINFSFAPQGSVSLSGHIYDALGNPLNSQHVYLRLPSGQLYATNVTDSSGAYLFQIEPGTYNIEIDGTNSNPSVNMPSYYVLYKNSYSINQSTVLDVTLPLKRVTVHVQNESGSPVNGVSLTTTPTNSTLSSNNLAIGGAISDASGFSYYSLNGGVSHSVTNTNGDANLWLFPNNSGAYAITARPSVVSGNVSQTTLSNVVITGDTTETITLPSPTTLSGHIYDALGNPLNSQHVYLRLPSGQLYATNVTDSSGAYLFQIEPGTYNIEIDGTNHNSAINMPSYYVLYKNNYLVNQSTVLDITLPLRKVTVHVQDDGLGEPVSGAHLITTPTNSTLSLDNLSMGSAISDASGFSYYDLNGGVSHSVTNAEGDAVLWLFPNNNGTYAITARPTSGNVSQATLSNIVITGDTTETIILPSSISLSGHVNDALGNPLTGQHVFLRLPSGQIYAHVVTNTSGEYSFQITPGTYSIEFTGTTNSPAVNLPSIYTLYKNNYTFSQSTVMNVAIPLKKVTVHVQNGAGDPVSGVSLTTTPTNSTLSLNNLVMGNAITDASGLAYYSLNGGVSKAITDTDGDAVLWLFPNNNGTYAITAHPSLVSVYAPFTLNNISITGDQTEIISLQYNHVTPTTEIDLATEHQGGTYSNPTTVTLSATAAAGYTIANTYYKVDGGAQQTYTAPFTVSGNGDHSIEYWSVDNSGVQEAHKTENFTIYINQAPYVDPLPDVEINQGQIYTATGSFTDADSTSWTATVDYGDGDGPVDLLLNPDKTFNLNHQYTTAGEYTVTVVVKDDGQATGQTSATVTVNGAPQIAALSDVEVNLQDTFMQDGSFTDNDSTSWTATVDYGDGTGEQDLTLNPDKTFHLEYTYQQADTYTVIVRIRDNQGAGAMEDFAVAVNAPPVIDPLPNTSVQEGATYTQSGSFTDDDSTSWTATVNYDEGAGIQPLPLNPDNTFDLNNLYEDNGTYDVEVRVTDDKGAFAIEHLTVIVNNANPQVGVITASINPIQVGTSTTATATFTDAGVLDTHIAQWSWGDGDTTDCPSVDCTISGSGGLWIVSASHQYDVADVYEINLTVTDDDAGIGQAPPYQYLAVYNPTSQGLFTGVRKFDSPAGAYPTNPTLSGQVMFGVSAKYQGTTPTGDVSMSFDAANFEFQSTGVSVLVITNGKATLKGTGTVNGQTGYTFLVTGLDGGSGQDDFVRFQIKNTSGTVIYDSQPNAVDTVDPTTLVTAGQIIVH